MSEETGQKPTEGKLSLTIEVTDEMIKVLLDRPMDFETVLAILLAAYQSVLREADKTVAEMQQLDREGKSVVH